MKRRLLAPRLRDCLAVLVIGSVPVACTSEADYRTAICALVDVSGTYTDEMPMVSSILRTAILPQLVPGDSLFLIGIDSDSYDEDNLWSKLTLDQRPSRANAQKLAFAAELTARLESVESARFTDISGAMLLCGDYLKGLGAGTELMLVLSDMQEELAPGVVREFDGDDLSHVDVLALNVIKLKDDNVQPAAYRKRLEDWQARVLAAGARSFEVVADSSNLPTFIAARRRR